MYLMKNQCFLNKILLYRSLKKTSKKKGKHNKRLLNIEIMKIKRKLVSKQFH